MDKKRNALSVLSAGVALAFALRREKRDAAKRAQALRPGGSASSASKAAAAKVGATGRFTTGKPSRANSVASKPITNKSIATKPSGAKPNDTRAAGGKAGNAGPGKTAGARPGVDAGAPAEIPLDGWWQIIKRMVSKFGENELLSEAASVTFFALLALFPAVTAIVSIYGLFADRATIEEKLNVASGFVPSGGMEIIRDQVHRLTQTPAGGLSLGAIVGLLAALWSANQGSKAMFSALNAVYGERESRGFVKLTITSLTFTLGTIVVLVAAIAAIVVLPLAFRAIGIEGSDVDLIARIGRWPATILLLILALSLLYRFAPSRKPARWRWVTWGGTVAAVAWVALSAGFSWYVSNFGNYNKTYGSLGAIIGFMTWIWLSATVLLVGGQLNAEMEAQTGRDSTVGEEKPVGARKAQAANTVAAK